MSSEKVKMFLEEKEQFEKQEKNKETDSPQLRYKVLSHYNLGEKVIYKDGDNIDDFPLTRQRSVGRSVVTERFKYECDITDEDFERILNIYNQEIESNNQSENEIDNSAEGIVKTFAMVALVVGIIAFVITLIVAFTVEEWSLIGTGIGLFVVGLFAYAFTKVFVNISYKLDKIANLLTKSEK